MICFNACIFLLRGFDVIFITFTIFIVFWSLRYLLRSQARIQKSLYHGYKSWIAQEFEKEKDKNIQWEVTPEQIIIRSVDLETRFTIDSIRKIIVCPQYLFLNLGFNQYDTLPRQAVAEAEYNAFCTYLIELYQVHARQHEKEAAIVQSDWAVDMASLCATKPMTFSFERVFFTALWGVLFLIAGILFFGTIALATMSYQDSTYLLPYDDDTLLNILAIGLLIGSALFGLTGLILGLRAKLPGTK